MNNLSAPGGPIPHNLARPLMVRQPYSVADLSTGGPVTSSRSRGKRGLVRKVEPSLTVRKDGMILELLIKEQKLKQKQ